MMMMTILMMMNMMAIELDEKDEVNKMLDMTGSGAHRDQRGLAGNRRYCAG